MLLIYIFGNLVSKSELKQALFRPPSTSGDYFQDKSIKTNKKQEKGYVNFCIFAFIFFM